jgi:hypothetical protein
MRLFKLLFLITCPLLIQAQCATQLSDYFNFPIGDEFELTHEDSPHFQDGPTDGVGITYQYTIMEDISDLEGRKYVVSGIRYDYSIHVFEETIEGVITPWEDTIVYLTSTYEYLNHCGDTTSFPLFSDGFNHEPFSFEPVGIFDQPSGKRIGTDDDYVRARYDTIHGVTSRNLIGIGFGSHDTLTSHISGGDTLGRKTPHANFILSTPTLTIEDASAHIYPNPSKDFIYIQGVEMKSWSILSNDGKVIASGIHTNRPIGIESLPNGNYLLVIKTSDHAESRHRIQIAH